MSVRMPTPQSTYDSPEAAELYRRIVSGLSEKEAELIERRLLDYVQQLYGNKSCVAQINMC